MSARDDLNWWSAYEFGPWWNYMDIDWLLKADMFREKWGKPCKISPHPDALGRHLGPKNTSQHNIDKWQKVKAGDIFPEGMDTKQDMARAYQIAVEVGFTGVGLYTDTKPSNMIHLDVRNDRFAGNPAKWARVDGKYVDIKQVIL